MDVSAVYKKNFSKKNKYTFVTNLMSNLRFLYSASFSVKQNIHLSNPLVEPLLTRRRGAKPLFTNAFGGVYETP